MPNGDSLQIDRKSQNSTVRKQFLVKSPLLFKLFRYLYPLSSSLLFLLSTCSSPRILSQELGKFLWVFLFHMCFQWVALLEAFSAPLAQIRLIAPMRLYVPFHCAFLGESSFTTVHLTLKLVFLVSVNFFMRKQYSAICKLLVANVTLEGCFPGMFVHVVLVLLVFLPTHCKAFPVTKSALNFYFYPFLFVSNAFM